MNAISKRLLSWLMVAVMVLSLLPALNLSDLAVETKANSGETDETKEIVYGTLNTDLVSEDIVAKTKADYLDDSDDALRKNFEDGYCPVCDKSVNWTTAFHSNLGFNTTVDHFFYDTTDALTSTEHIVKLDSRSDKKLCIAVTSQTTISAASGKAILYVTSSSQNNTVNIMGNGTLQCDAQSTVAGKDATKPNIVNLYGCFLKGPVKASALQLNIANNCVVNMYDGVVIGPEQPQTTTTRGLIRMNGTDVTMNIYGGTIRNGHGSEDLFGPNIAMLRGTINMYGGTITGGKATGRTGGNVYVKDNYNNGAVFNMYGGTIEKGSATSATYGGNVAVVSGEFNMYGGTVTEGTTDKVAGGTGGNIHVQGGTLRITGTALVEKGDAYQGGNIFNNKTVEISGGKISGGTSQHNGGSINNAGTLTISGGTISGGTASGTYGGNVCNTGKLTISGGTISGGTATHGGNVYGGGTFSMTGGTVENGLARGQGGNIYVNVAAELKDVTVLNGQAYLGGGNIAANKALTLTGATVANGWASGNPSGDTYTWERNNHWGGNIRAVNVNVTINAGTLIYGGSGGPDKANPESSREHNVGVKGTGVLTINGGTIVGGIQTAQTVVLTGAPKILKSYEVDGKTVNAPYGYVFDVSKKVNIDGLSNQAEIWFDNATDGDVISVASSNAETVVDRFFHSTLLADVNSSNELELYKIVGQLKGKDYVTTSYRNITDMVADYEAAVAEDKEVYMDLTKAHANKGEAENAILDIVLNNAETEYCIDSYDVIVNLSGQGKVRLMDSNNDDLSGNGDYYIAEEANIEVMEDAVNPVSGKRYVSVRPDADRNHWQAYYVDVEMTNVTLRTSEAGLYYKAAYKFADSLRESGAVKGYGVVLGLEGMPDKDFDPEGPNCTYKTLGDECTYINGNNAADGLTVNGTSGSVFGILKEIGTDNRTAARNFSCLTKDLYANAYMAIDRDPWGEETIYYVMANTDNNSSKAEVKMNLLQAVSAINDSWSTLDATPEAKASMVEFVNNWADATKLTDEGLTAWTAATSNIQ